MERVWFEICQKHKTENGEETELLNGPFGVVADLDAALEAGRKMFGDDAVVRQGNPDDIQGWGVGKDKDKKAYASTYVGKQKVDLIFGEHPHSRRDNNTYARFSDGKIEGFDGHTLLHEITFKDYNYLKESELSGDQVRKGGTCTISINGTVVETFFYREIENALHRAAHRLTEIHEFPVRLWDEKDKASLIGRKIYFRNQPAIITDYFEDQACVMIKHDPEDTPFVPAPYDLEGVKNGEQVEYFNQVKDSIYSKNIWWWRD